MNSLIAEETSNYFTDVDVDGQEMESSDEFEYFAQTVLLETELNKIPLGQERHNNEERRSELIASLVTSTIITPPGLALSRLDIATYCV